MTAVQITRTLVPAVAPNGVAKDRPSMKILLDPQAGTYHCADCDFTAATYDLVRGHRRSAHPKIKAVPAAPKPDLASRLDQIATLLAEVRAEVLDTSDDRVDAEWKTRAQAAERRLATLRRALKGE